jgi:hypothetical protein
MSQDKPQPNIQITPVGFSPPKSDDAVGTIMPAPRPETRFPVFLPILIILLTLNFSTLRDIVALNKRMTQINEENAPALDLLKKSAKQSDFVNGLRTGLINLAPNDPAAADILKQFFPPPPVDKSDASAPPASSTPAASTNSAPSK